MYVKEYNEVTYLDDDEFEEFQKELVEHSIETNEKLKELLNRKKSWENSDVR